MNRRQKKKQFKKVYGMSPKQYKKLVYGHLEEINDDAVSAYCEWAKTVIEQAVMATVEAIKVIHNTINKWMECVQAAAGTIEAYNLQERERKDGENGINS